MAGRRKKNSFQITGAAKVGIALILLGLLFVFGSPRPAEDLSGYTFASEPVEVAGFEETSETEGKLPNRVIVPELGIDIDVASAGVVNGYWEVFEDKAGWGEGSAFPGQEGNQVIFAHAREGLFLPLRDVTAGMRVYVLSDNEWFGYEIEETTIVSPNQTEVIAPTEDETLTLYTCSGFKDQKRLIVRAKPV